MGNHQNRSPRIQRDFGGESRQKQPGIGLRVLPDDGQIRVTCVQAEDERYRTFHLTPGSGDTGTLAHRFECLPGGVHLLTQRVRTARFQQTCAAADGHTGCVRRHRVGWNDVKSPDMSVEGAGYTCCRRQPPAALVRRVQVYE